MADVKFFNWTEIVFAKFKSVEAAERFIGLRFLSSSPESLSMLSPPLATICSMASTWPCMMWSIS